MKCHRLNEVLELLQPYWSKEPDLHLLQILQKIADETDLVIIYHFKMCDKDRF